METHTAGTLLEVTELRTGYLGVEVLHGIELVVRPGETVCVLGANGAGKTTLLHAIMCRQPTWSGNIRLRGVELGGAPPFAPARLGLSYVPEGRGVLASLTVRENLELGAYPPRARARLNDNLERVLALFPPLKPRLGEPAANLSGGQQQMLVIGRALMAAPELILLDEPSLGLSPAVTGQVYSALAQLKSSGQAILLVEQNVSMALKLGDRAYVMEQGRIVVSGGRERVLADPRLRNAYLGL